MLSVADEEKLKECANFLINVRGYLVVGLIRGEYLIGEIIHELWDSQVRQPCRVISVTDRADWIEQGRMAGDHFGAEFKSHFYHLKGGGHWSAKSEHYYRVITD